MRLIDPQVQYILLSLRLLNLQYKEDFIVLHQHLYFHCASRQLEREQEALHLLHLHNLIIQVGIIYLKMLYRPLIEF